MNMADSTINNGDGPTHATVCIWVFTVSALWHYTSSASEIISYWFRYDLQDSDARLAFAEEHFVHQNWFERKYMSFRLVDDPFPKRCRH